MVEPEWIIRIVAGVLGLLATLSMIMALALDCLFTGYLQNTGDTPIKADCGWAEMDIEGQESLPYDNPESIAADQKSPGILWLVFGIFAIILGLISSLYCFIPKIPKAATMTGLCLATLSTLTAVFAAFAPWGDKVCESQFDIGVSLILALISGFFLSLAVCIMCMLCVGIGTQPDEKAAKSVTVAECYAPYDSYDVESRKAASCIDMLPPVRQVGSRRIIGECEPMPRIYAPERSARDRDDLRDCFSPCRL